MRRFIIAICGMIIFTGSAQAELRKVFQSGRWHGLAFYADDTKQFQSCGIGSTYQNGVTITIILSPEGEWSIHFFRKEGFGGAEKQQVQIYVDEEAIYQGSPRFERNTLKIQLENSERAVNALQKGRLLKFASSPLSFGLALEVISGALAPLYDCVQDRAGTTTAQSQDAPPPRPGQPPGGQPEPSRREQPRPEKERPQAEKAQPQPAKERLRLTSTKVFQAGWWHGLAIYFTDSRKFQSCAITSRYKSGITIAILLGQNGQWFINFYRKEGFGEAAEYQFQLHVDNVFVYEGFARREKDLLRMTLDDSKRVINALQNGRLLKVVSSQGTSVFQLEAISEGITQLYKCVGDRAGTVMAESQGAFGKPRSDQPPGREPPGREPQGRQPPQGGREPPHRRAERKPPPPAPRKEDDANKYKFPRQQVLNYVTSLLSEAGVVNYRILPYEQTKGWGDVSWQLEDGLLGAISAFRPESGLVLQTMAAILLKNHSEGCPGDFAGGKKAPRFFKGAEIYRIGMSCRAGPKSFRAEFSLFRQPQGATVQLMTARLGAEKSGEDGFDGPSIDRREEIVLGKPLE